jgi:hypothetical protein
MIGGTAKRREVLHAIAGGPSETAREKAAGKTDLKRTSADSDAIIGILIAIGGEYRGKCKKWIMDSRRGCA